MSPLERGVKILLVGPGATVVMDIWSALLRSRGIPTLDYALLGRWAGHIWQGRLMHDNIARAASVPGEGFLGWTLHYLIGITFAALLVGAQGEGWLRTPTLWPALVLGVITIIFPLFVMQPAMGAGIAASRTPTPLQNNLRSLATHAVFGFGLYLAALLLKVIWA